MDAHSIIIPAKIERMARLLLVEWLAASLRGHTHLAALGKINPRIKDDLIARLDSGVHFHLRAHVARHVEMAGVK
jgi:hypothetical protein